MDSPKSGPHIVFLDFLRGPAALLVVWDHMVALWLDRNNLTWTWLETVRASVNQPFGLIQDFGWLGVCLFFLISGFVITHVALRERPLQFVLNRLCRIYPPLIVSILLIVVLAAIFFDRHYSIGDIVLAGTLFGYLQSPQVIINRGAWTLVIEMLFYVLTLAGFRLLSHPVRWLVIELCLVTLVIYFARSGGSAFFLFAASFSYLPYLFLGQLLYYALWRQTVSVAGFAVLFASTLAVLVYGLKTIHTEFLPIENSYLVTLLVALSIFVIALMLNPRLRQWRVVRVLANWSYALYLFHTVVGILVLDKLYDFLGYQAALVVALCAVAGVCALSYRYVEAPAQAFARKLWRRIGSARAE